MSYSMWQLIIQVSNSADQTETGLGIVKPYNMERFYLCKLWKHWILLTCMPVYIHVLCFFVFVFKVVKDKHAWVYVCSVASGQVQIEDEQVIISQKWAPSFLVLWEPSRYKLEIIDLPFTKSKYRYIIISIWFVHLLKICLWCNSHRVMWRFLSVLWNMS